MINAQVETMPTIIVHSPNGGDGSDEALLIHKNNH